MTEICAFCNIPKDSYCHKLSIPLCPSISDEKYNSLWDIWDMETCEYDSQLQWLPKEVLEDVIALVNVSEFTSKPADPWHVYGDYTLRRIIEMTGFNMQGINQEDAYVFSRFNNPYSFVPKYGVTQQIAVKNILPQNGSSSCVVPRQVSRNPVIKTVGKCIACMNKQYRKTHKKQGKGILCLTCYKQ